MMCNCKLNITEQERWDQQILLEVPDGFERARRIKSGLSSKVCIDPCIIDEIKDLWELGIETLSCCCGHNYQNLFAHVTVRQVSINKMIALGYETHHWDKERKDNFKLKSV